MGTQRCPWGCNKGEKDVSEYEGPGKLFEVSNHLLHSVTLLAKIWIQSV